MESSEDQRVSFESLGLRTDPFDVSWIDTTDGIGVKMSMHAASQRLLSAIDEMASDPDHRPVVVRKGDVPATYHVVPLSRALRLMAIEDPVPGIASYYVPIDMMRIGRARAVLHTVAEWVAGVGTIDTLAAMTRQAFVDPSTELAEWQALQPFSEELAGLLEDVTTDPSGVVVELLGEPEAKRKGAEDSELMMRVAYARVGRLETDPDESADASTLGEEAADDPMGDALITRLGDDEELKALDEAPAFETLAAHYVIAYAAAEYSPVIARGLKAYVAQGVDSMTEELKVSKAPTKTVAALLRLLALRMRASAVIFDRFEMWDTVPADLRLKIVATLTSMRWAIKDSGALVLLVPAGGAPEVEEAFASARTVSWDYDELARVESRDALFDKPAAESWIASFAVDGEVPQWAHELLAAMPPETTLEAGVAALSAVVREAAEKGLAAPETAALESALKNG